ncbi:MAG: DUF4363 family protein [Oscillospiraceae bacterium]|nr:DUF4363 family protein [Oscillospiraceae bacterium]
MKRVKAAAVLIVIIILLSVGSLFILSHLNRDFKGRLYEIRSAYESGDTAKAQSLADELEAQWHSYEKKVTMLVHDDELKEIALSVSKISPFIADDSDEVTAEIDSACNQIDRLYEEEFPHLHNIL